MQCSPYARDADTNADMISRTVVFIHQTLRPCRTVRLQEGDNEGTETNDGAGNGVHGSSGTSGAGTSTSCAAHRLSISASGLAAGGGNLSISSSETSARVARGCWRGNDGGAAVDVCTENDGGARVGTDADNIGVETRAEIGDVGWDTNRGSNRRLRGENWWLRSDDWGNFSRKGGLAGNNTAGASLGEEARLGEGVDGGGRALSNSCSGESRDGDEDGGAHVDCFGGLIGEG